MYNMEQIIKTKGSGLMERTGKAKIALGILIAALAVRCILHYLFPIPLEFAPYDGKSESGLLQTLNATDIRFVFAYASEGQEPTYFYRVHTQDGNEGVLLSRVKYRNETFETPVRFTGRTLRLPDPPEENKEAFYGPLLAEPGYQQEYGLDKEGVYRETARLTALDLSFTDTERENPACFWFSLLAAIAFIWMLALLLSEYFGRRRGTKGPDKKSGKV